MHITRSHSGSCLVGSWQEQSGVGGRPGKMIARIRDQGRNDKNVSLDAKYPGSVHNPGK